MTVGAVLICYAMAVGTFGAAGARRAAWPLRAPRLGAAAVLAAAWSVPLALALAGVTLALPTGALTVDLGHLIGACLMRLRAAYGTPAGVGIMTVGQLLSAAMVGRIAWAIGCVAHRRRLAWRRHGLLMRLAGEHRPGVAAVVLDHPGPAAYSVGGRRPAVVVTSGAIDLLTGPELEAVLAHENAHLSARHHRIQAAAALIAAALPIVPLARDAPALVGRLLEMDADECAAGEHERQVLVSALAVVTAAGGVVGAHPKPSSSSTRGFAGSDAAARVRRLTSPPIGLAPRRATLTRFAVAGVSVAPLLLAVAPALIALY